MVTFVALRRSTAEPADLSHDRIDDGLRSLLAMVHDGGDQALVHELVACRVAGGARELSTDFVVVKLRGR